MSADNENRPPAEEAGSEGIAGGTGTRSVAAAESRIRVRRRAEARHAGWEFGVLFGLEDVLLACTDPDRDDLGRDWHEFAWTIQRRDHEGQLLAEAGAR